MVGNAKVTFQNLSSSLATIINEVASEQSVCKLLSNNSNDPLNGNNIADTSELIMKLIKPFPFDLAAGGDARSELRVWFPDGELRGNQIIGEIQIYFDIVVDEKLWTISNNVSSSIRPYEIAHYLTDHFQNKSIGTIGKLRFDKGFNHLGVNSQFSAIRLKASMTMGK